MNNYEKGTTKTQIANWKLEYILATTTKMKHKQQDESHIEKLYIFIR